MTMMMNQDSEPLLYLYLYFQLITMIGRYVFVIVFVFSTYDYDDEPRQWSSLNEDILLYLFVANIKWK